jgi:DNA helicase-2/ATP-dependent DNA helicase PcrA
MLAAVSFLADLHIHSHHSRATSKDLTLEHLHGWAQRKGISVVGTGDFTHPRWFAELREKLVPVEGGLFALREDLARAVDAGVPAACRAPVRFLLSVEVSSIYKRGGKVRKVHNLAYAPHFEVAAEISARLARIGNIASDGRPILGLDSRDFLEIVLTASPDAFVVPAHIWTPWFSALGAQSGFDAISECFADLSSEIFAVETGLSSDPAMNWRLSQLDRYALVSNSDAHSPEKLGREASWFDGEPSYYGLRDALRSQRERFLGTLEFFPEEGKYHFDGHRLCGVSLTPEEARAASGICPSCGKRLTGGVLGRVATLADRPEGVRPPDAKSFQSLIPLTELLSELADVGAGTARVSRAYDRLLERVGPELGLLREVPSEELERHGPPLFAEAITRMRAGRVQLVSGYDGEYGVVRVFDPEERRRLLGQRSFGFAGLEAAGAGLARAARRGSRPLVPGEPMQQVELPGALERGAVALEREQQRAVDHEAGPLLVLAGPGTGKTRVIVQRIARLVRSGISARAITAISFTRRAAGELRERLEQLLGARARPIDTLTFHALGLGLLRAFPEAAGLPHEPTLLDEPARARLLAEAAAECGQSLEARDAASISRAKAELLGPEGCAPELAPLYAAYERRLAASGALDFDDLVLRAVRLLESSAEALAAAHERCRHLFVDEYQDVNPAQERLVRLLAPAEPGRDVCVVGDPDQSIYGFRGSDPGSMQRFLAQYPGASVLALTRNHRSPAAVVRAATSLIEASPGRPPRALAARAESSAPVELVCLPSERDEADFVAAEIERALGGTSFGSMDAGRADGNRPGQLAFHDIAVLFRTSAQADVLERALDREGIPHQRAGEESLCERTQVAALIERLRSLVDPASAACDLALAEEVGRLPVADLISRLALSGAPLARQAREASELLATLAVPFRLDAAAFLAHLPLWQSADLPFLPQRVALLTLHAAKGLEFPLVFITGCEDGLLPLSFPGRPPGDVEEERRLLYVGMTRAKARLVLTRAQQRLLSGSMLARAPSPFLDAIPAALLQLTAPARSRRAVQLSLL